MTQSSRYPASGGLFEAVRAIPAHEAAQRLGLSLTRRGGRYWALCPMHGEKTPSLCFYPDGRYYCFGCHAHGSTVDLYMSLCGLSALDAARQAASDFGVSAQEAAYTPRPVRPTREMLRRTRSDSLNRTKSMRDAAHKKLAQYSTDDAWDDPEFLLALQMRAQADELCGMLDGISDEELADALPQ